MTDPGEAALATLGRAVRDRVRRSLLDAAPAAMARPAGEAAGDLQYAIDRIAEDALLACIRDAFGQDEPLRVLSEGLAPEGVLTGGPGPRRLLLVDPIDGTRGLMHDKRSAFFLAALLPDGDAPRLSHATQAALVEIPGTRSVLSDVMTAARGQGVRAVTDDLATGGRRPFVPRPSGATGLAHGFASVARFFGGAKAAIGAFEDDLLRRVSPEGGGRGALVFEDQYISNGGQLWSLATGRDRFVADLRPLFARRLGAPLICAHAYDLAAALVAEEAGVVLTDPAGRPFDAPVDLTGGVAFVGYANAELRRRVEPHLRAALTAAGLLPDER